MKGSGRVDDTITSPALIITKAGNNSRNVSGSSEKGRNEDAVELRNRATWDKKKSYRKNYAKSDREDRGT